LYLDHVALTVERKKKQNKKKVTSAYEYSTSKVIVRMMQSDSTTYDQHERRRRESHRHGAGEKSQVGPTHLGVEARVVDVPERRRDNGQQRHQVAVYIAL
jgi:hypothetical protein